MAKNTFFVIFGQLPTTKFSDNTEKLRPVQYYNKKINKEDIGFIAHEVQEEIPFLVTGEKDGEQIQSLNYSGLIGILVKEVQDLKQRVKILEENNNIKN